ncbi:MAG: AAA family ATPase [Kangiella sp.]|nr:MAG: AAA family ATPase [Kangiella sp.]
MLNEKLNEILDTLSNIILGKPEQLKLALVCLLAQGHLLIEDLPGMGKTTLAHALAKILGLEFQRIQFTSDILPGDITGSSIYKRSNESFEFHKGPIFTQVVLADEINRASPKSQSALLEAMEEGQVTADGNTYELPNPFFVIATQNSFHQIGTYPLPESQLDRFLIRITLGFPEREFERKLLSGNDSRKQIAQLQAKISTDELKTAQRNIEEITVSEALYDYLQDLIDATRESNQWSHGLSPRAGLSVLKASKAWAFLQEREFVIPEDIQAVWCAVTEHRLLNESMDKSYGKGFSNPVKNLLQQVAIPR